MSNENNDNTAPVREPRGNSTDTLILLNLPEHFKRSDLLAWCDNSFTSQPFAVRVKKPRVREGEPPAVRYGFLQFEDHETANATLNLLNDEVFVVGNDVQVQAQWAAALRPRNKNEGQDQNHNSADGKGNTTTKTTRRRRRKGKNKRADEDNQNNNVVAAANPEPVQIIGRVYIKNFGTEENLNKILSNFGDTTDLDLKEVRRGPGAGSKYAFATYSDQAAADAAIAAHGSEDPQEGELVMAHAKPLVVRSQKPRKSNRKKIESLRLEEPSTLDLCCRNLPYSMTEQDLLGLFADYDSASSARIITRGGRSRGYGFVHFEDEAQTTSAQANLSGKEVGKSTKGDALELRLDFALSAPRPILDQEAADAAAASGSSNVAVDNAE